MLSAPLGMVASAGHQDDDDDEDDESSSSQDNSSDDDSASASSSSRECYEPGFNMECNEFGDIRMQSNDEVRGEPIETTTYINLDRSFEDREEGPDARWVMFAVRNVTPAGESPVEVEIDGFETNTSGEIITTREDRESPSEINLWVDVLDLPIDEEIRVEATVGVTELGAYQLETIVIPFDRAYDPLVHPNGESISLFSFTMLGVHEPTSSLGAGQGEGWIATAQEIPTVGALVAMLTLGTMAAATARRGDQ